MSVDEVTVLREALAAHRSGLVGALASNAELDLDRALQVHAGLSGMLAHWADYSAAEQRKIVATVEYLLDPIDPGGRVDLRDPDGFADDLARFDPLRHELGHA